MTQFGICNDASLQRIITAIIPNREFPFSLAATAEKRVDLVDASDELGPRFPAGCKPGTVGLRRIGRIVLQRYSEEDFAPACDPAMSIRVCPVVMDERGFPVSMATSTPAPLACPPRGA